MKISIDKKKNKIKKIEDKENKVNWLAPEVRFLDNCLLINNKILVLGDLHIGFEEHIIEKGIFPRIQLKDIFERLKNIFKLLKEEKVILDKIIILGDLKHEFGGISDTEWKEVMELLSYLNKKCKDIILIKGNHDNILGPIAKKSNVKLKNYYKIKKKINKKDCEICFAHGHKNFKGCESSDILIIGHLHPAITLSDNYKKEKYKCFLKGRWKGKLVYVLPSFSLVSFGFDLRSIRSLEKSKGFLIINSKKLEGFEVIVYNNKDKKYHNFGKLKKFVE